MTYALEALGKANPKPSSVGAEGFSTSKPLIGVMDKVAALKYIKGPFRELKTEYAFAKFVHLRTGDTLNKLARSYVIRKAIREKWALSKGEGKEVIYALAYTAIEEAVADKRCKTCKGTGEITVKNEVIVCPSCKGSGARQPMSIMRLSNDIRVSEWRSRDYWLSKYRELVDDFLLFDFEASKAINRLTIS